MMCDFARMTGLELESPLCDLKHCLLAEIQTTSNMKICRLKAVLNDYELHINSSFQKDLFL